MRTHDVSHVDRRPDVLDEHTRETAQRRSTYGGGPTAVAISEPAPKARVSWGPVWAGLVMTLAVYLVLQLTLIATSLVDLPVEGDADGWWSAGAALSAFLLGGIVAGGTAAWRGTGDGMVHGLVMWAVAIAALLASAALGSGIALGSLDTTQVFEDLSANLDTADPGLAQDAAGWSLFGMLVAAVAAVIGGALGGALGHRDRRFDAYDDRLL